MSRSTLPIARVVAVILANLVAAVLAWWNPANAAWLVFVVPVIVGIEVLLRLFWPRRPRPKR